MSWIEGTATDYRDMLDQLIEIATSDHVDTVSVGASGGSNYAVDEIITLTDGTFTHAARMRVTSVDGGGAITGIRVEDGGAYTVDPDLTDTTSHTSSGSGTGAQLDLTMNSEPWTVERRAQEAVSATVFSGGTGYSNGDQIRVSMNGGGVLGADGETFYGVAPVFQVTGNTGGVIDTVSLVTAGHLEEVPDIDGTAGSQCDTETVTGSGSGAQLTVTYQDVGSSQEDVIILSAPGEGGTDQILHGIRTFQATDVSGFLTCFNWQLFAMVNFNSALALHEQVNISYGADPTDGAIETDGGSFMVLKEDDADPDITFWMSVTNRRIILVCKVETASTAFYSSMYMGFVNAYETTNENPYPIYVQGTTSRENSHWSDDDIGRISGLSDCYAVNTKLNGPGQYRADAGEWRSFLNAICVDGGSPTRSVDSDFVVFPCGVPSLSPQVDDELIAAPADGVQFEDIHPESGVPGTPDVLLRPTPNTGDDVRILVPLAIIATDDPTSPARDVYRVLGELDNCFWVSASDPTTDLTSEDVQKIGDDRYIVFQNGNQTEAFSYFCVKAE